MLSSSQLVVRYGHYLRHLRYVNAVRYRYCTLTMVYTIESGLLRGDANLNILHQCLGSCEFHHSVLVIELAFRMTSSYALNQSSPN